VTIQDLIDRVRGEIASKLEARNGLSDQLAALRDEGTSDGDAVADLRSQKDALDAELDALAARVADLEAEQARDDAAARLQSEVHTTGATREAAPAAPVRVGQEARTYRPDLDPKGSTFLLDVGRSFLGDPSAQGRLQRHMQEEEVERGQSFVVGQSERAAGTGAFSGLVVPQYLTDLYAPSAKANRPFANVANQHDLPAEGMTVNISRITTGTSAAVQASENSAVSETNIDDTLLSPAVQTNSGQQTLSRQAVERGTGVDSVMLDDLFRSYHTTLDSTLLNQATNGLTNVATSIAYTDATPTVAELYPKFLQALAAVEAALLDQDPADNIAVMHSRRWYWLQNALGTSWPIVQQPDISPQQSAINFATAYGSGFRGVLPNGTPVIVDNNVATNLGAGTNEDEIYIGSRREFHLWEDPTAPMLIRAEQPAAASLGILFVVYGYFAYTHARYAHAQKLGGTGLVTPTWTGV
jgi:HK97 family phage major capsid protein